MLRRLLLLIAVACAVAGCVLLLARMPSHSGPAGAPPAGSSPAEASPAQASTRAVVGVRVVDGDTLDVRLEGQKVRVRLLNVDAPEASHDGAPAQCLAAEATRWLAAVAGKGTALLLSTYGEDRFGRTLGGLYDERGRLLNAELVRAGLAAPMVVNRQVDLIAPVRDAQQEAADAATGLHAADGCTVPGRLVRLEAVVARLPVKAADSRTATGQLAKAREAARTLDGIASDLDGDQRNALVDGLTKAELSSLEDRVAIARARLAVVIPALESQT